MIDTDDPDIDAIALCPGNVRHRVKKLRASRKAARAFGPRKHTARWRKELMSRSAALVRKIMHDKHGS